MKPVRDAAGFLPPDVVTALLRARYQYAYSMPESPHYYTLAKTWTAPALWERAVTACRELGERRPYIHAKSGRRYYSTYLDINGFKYWVFEEKYEGHPVPSPARVVPLINRTAKEYPGVAIYNHIAGQYDIQHCDPTSERESRTWMARVAIRRGENVLDVGCGTGLLVDYKWKYVDPYRYVGIDPSEAMLGVFAAKHPDFTGSLYRTTLEDFQGLPQLKVEMHFDVVVAAFGPASYVPSDVLVRRLTALLSPAGRALLMFYREQSAQRYYDMYSRAAAVRMDVSAKTPGDVMEVSAMLSKLGGVVVKTITEGDFDGLLIRRM